MIEKPDMIYALVITLIPAVVGCVSTVVYFTLGGNKNRGFMPMTVQEWQVRSDNYSTESILKLDCKTLISNKDYNGSMGYFYVLDDHGVGGTDITKKFKECGLY